MIRVIDLVKESCDLKTWKTDHAAYSCCKHPDGFYVFLSPDEINISDEYKEQDPYSVIHNLTGDFQQRRLNCTIELIGRLNLTGNRKLLDVGCGQGHFTNQIKKDFQNYEIYGLDYSVTAIQYANSNFTNIDFVVADAYEPPYPDEYFDVIICNNIWEHVPDPLNLLKSISRILKPNGHVIISTPSRYRFDNLLRIVRGKKTVFMSKLHVTEYTIGQVKEQLQSGGYEVEVAYAPAIKEKIRKYRIYKALFAFVIKLIKSHHILESTVFYSAKKLPSQQ